MQLQNPELARSVIRKLIYFDIFSHPLLADEIFEYCDYADVDKTQAFRVLAELKAGNLVSSESGYYFIGNDSSTVVRRIEGNHRARLRMDDANKYAAIAAGFPFVRAVFISGSLSKHVMKPESDVDFFIITEPGKLWICRAFLTIYKKLILGNSHRNFCLNYFIDSDNLEIPDKNIFTATEIAFLLPMYNYPMYEAFMQKNIWVRAQIPNFKLRDEAIAIHPGSAKKMFESVFNNWFGGLLDWISLKVILGYWKIKFRNQSENMFAINFRSQKNVSKHHPDAFQERVLKGYSEKILAFEKSTGFLLNHSAEK